MEELNLSCFLYCIHLIDAGLVLSVLLSNSRDVCDPFVSDVVLIHGWGGVASGLQWLPSLESLSNRSEVLFIKLLSNHNCAPVPGWLYTEYVVCLMSVSLFAQLKAVNLSVCFPWTFAVLELWITWLSCILLQDVWKTLSQLEHISPLDHWLVKTRHLEKSPWVWGSFDGHFTLFSDIL